MLTKRTSNTPYSLCHWIPISLPFALVPIVPNVPGFYIAYRLYCNVKALLGVKHLDYLLEDCTHIATLCTCKYSSEEKRLFNQPSMTPSTLHSSMLITWMQFICQTRHLATITFSLTKKSLLPPTSSRRPRSKFRFATPKRGPPQGLETRVTSVEAKS